MAGQILKITCAAGLLAMAMSISVHPSWAAEHVDDAAVMHAVEDALVAHPVAGSHEIKVSVYNGIVQLNGFVASDNVREAAVKAAKDVSGVASVHDNLKIRPDNRPAAEVQRDSDLTKKVENALIANPATKSHEIYVATADSVVQLAGFVDSADIRTTAAEIAGAVPGVRRVQNELEMK
ncbi:MAG TPA: BON domain-containing protein [Pseudomonadales bacterium]|jgi:hyperosmotically inducible protein|nr:BON domain-containing protein [Pseudomonadales bacterium]